MALQPERKKSRSLSLASIAQISNDISRKFLDRSDLARLLRIVSTTYKDQTPVLEVLDAFFISNPQAKIKLVFVDDTVYVKNIFIMSPAMQELAQNFPEHLYVDLLSNIRPGFNLYSVSCEVNSGWKMCASCISKANNPETLRFLIVSVLQSIPKIKGQIKTITVHPGIEDRLYLGMLLPNVILKHSILLLDQALDGRMSNLESATKSQIKIALNIMLNTRSLKVYNRQLDNFKAVCPAEIFQYYFENWHSIRKLWFSKENKHQLKTEQAIYTYVTSLHYTLATEMGISPSLKACLHVVLNDDLELKSGPDVSSLPEPLPVVDVPEQPTSPHSIVSEEVQQTHEERETNGLEHMEFSSWDEFQLFFTRWCVENKIMFIIRSSVPLNDDNMSQELIQSLKFDTVSLGCSTYTRKRCPALIQLTLGPEKDKLIITKADLNHIHDSEIDLPSRFTRKPISYVEVPVTLSNGVSDKFMDRNDLTKLLRFPFGGESQLLDELESLFNSDPTAKVKFIYTEDKLIVKYIFVMTTIMQNLLHHFPEHIYVDYLSGLNQEFDLYSVLCQDENFSWKVCTLCVTRKELSESLRFLLTSVLHSLPNLSNQVKYVTLSPEIQNIACIETLFPNASVRYCLPLILDCMHRKISFLSQMEQFQIKNLLLNLAQASSMDLYRLYLVELKAACPDEVFQYYFDTWHPCWKLWAEKDSRVSAVENTVFTYVESKHQDIKSQVGAMPSLHQCLQVILVEDLHQYLQVILVEEQTKDQLCETNHSADLDQSNSSACKSSNSASVEFQEEQGPPPLEDCSTSVLQKDCEEVENDQLNGKEFQSWDEFCAYLETWSKEKYLVHQSSALTENSNCENPAVLDMVSSFKYSWVQLLCNRKDCSSFIELTLSPQKEKLVITQSNLNHNHDVEETTLPPPAKKCKLSTAVGLPAQVANNISRKFLEPSDLRRLLRFRSGAFEDRTQVLAELEKLFIADPQAKVKLVFVEDKLLVNKILLMTSAMKEVAHKFHEHLFIDLFSEFSQGFDLYSIFCEEKGVGWNVCAYCIAKKGVEGILDFLISSVVQIIPTLNGQVKHITLHPEISETVQLEPHLQHVTTRYCMHLLLDVLYHRVSHLDTTVAAQIKNYLHILSQTCSLKVYDRYLNDLKAICPAEIFQYYYDTWHPRRKMWAKKDNKVEESEKKIFELVTQNHEKLKSTLGPVPSLHQCLCAVLGDSHKTSGNKSYLQEANMTQFCHLEESSAISPLNEQAQECELPLLDDDEGGEHKETSTNQLQELPTSIDNRENSTVPSSVSCNTVKQEGDCISRDINGMKFYSWHQFCEYFDHLCEMKKTAYKIISAIHFAKTHDKAEVFKFQEVQLGCQIFHNEPSNEICAVREYVPNSCPAKLTLQFSTDENCLVVSEAKLQHNHKAEHQKFDVPFRYYSLTSYTELYLLVNSFAGRFIKPQEVSLLLKWKHSLNKTVLDLLEILKALFLEDSMSIVKLDISPETMQLECVFIMTSKMKYLLECFPSFLFLGKPLSVNESYDLYTAMCEDNKKNSRECAYFITLKERPTPFPDLLVFLIQSIPNLKICVKDLLLQIDLKELQLVRELLPSCRVRISQTHALNALYHHVKESDPITQEKLKGLMYSLVNCCSPDLYNTYFTELETSSSDNFLQYFLQTWHSCKNDWCHGMKEGHFLECAAQQKEMLTTLAQSPVSPAVCIQALIKTEGVNSEDNPDEQPMEISVSNEQAAGCEMNCVTSDSTSPVSSCGILIQEERPVKQLHLKGKIFQSWDMFCEFFDQYCKENKCLYKIAKVTRFIDIEEADLHHFRYQQAVLLCKGTGEQHQPRLNFSTMQLPCSASVTVQFSTENHCLVISQEHLQHNHVLDPHVFDTCFSHCSLTSRAQFAALITNIANCFITPHHIKELMKWSNALEPNLCDLLKELEILLSDDAMVKMKLVFCPETFCLESVFIMTSQAMNLLENFPSMLFLGHSLMLNESFDLYTVLCEDNESNGRECAYFITHKETTKPVLQMVVCLTQSIPEIIERIEVIVLRVDLKELDQIQDLLPSCCVRMSQAHALDVLYHQIREEDPPTQETLKKLMYNLVHSQTSSIYNSYFDELKSMASENFLHYFEHTWHIRKEDWAECWSHKMKDGNFLEFSQWQPNDLRPMLNFPSSLATCIRALLNLVRTYNMQCSKTNSSQDITTKEAEHHSQTPAVLEKSLLTLESLDVTKKQEESLDVTKKQETEHHSQSPAILDNSSLALKILDVEVQKQEVAELNINTHSEATESNNDSTLQLQAEVPTAKVLDDVRNGINSIESHAIQDIPSTSSTHYTSDEIINEERPFNCSSLEGRVFLSWIEFRNFFDRWCERNMALYKVKCCRPLCRTDTFITPAAKMITVLKYSFLYLVCKYSTVSNSSMTDSSGELSSPCQSCIIVQAGPCNDRLIITHAELDHNHKIMEEEFDRCFPRFMLKGKPFQFLEMSKSVSKQFLTLKDLQGLVDRSCNEEPSIRDLLHELNCVCCQDPKVKIKLVFYPDIVEVDCCFIMTYSMRRMLESFPSLLYIDRSPSINEDFDLYTAHIEDANNRGRACAYLITRKESQTPVRFMMVSLLQSISNTVKSKITTVVLHAGFEELDLVKSFLRKRTVKMSQAYALEALHGRVEQEAQSVHKAIKSIISKIVWSNSPEEYQSNLRELEAIALTDFFQYFLQNWHSSKETWVAYCSLPEPQRTRFPNHVRIYHQNLQSTFSLPTSLAHCVSELLKLQSLKALTTTLDEHMISLFFQELCQPDVLKLVQEEIVLTKQGLYEIKEVDKGFMLNDGTSDFLLNQGITKCSCSIFKSSSLPCRHIFATRLWIGEAILDVKLLQVNKSKV